MTPDRFQNDFLRFKDTRFERIESSPSLNEDTGPPHQEWSYILHLAWAARILAETRPTRHVDISSYIYFPFLVSAFIPIDYYEYRNFGTQMSNLICKHADLKNLPFDDESLKSLSCMHTIEHIGLGRYGDEIDPYGDRRAAIELKRSLAKRGRLLIVAPVGKPILRFNSHRTYSYEMVIEMFQGLKLLEFSLIPDQDTGSLIHNANPVLVERQPGDSTGCFLFMKDVQ